MAEAEATGGQATADSTTGTTASAPGTSGSVTGGSSQTTGNGPDAGAIESFFDPASIAGKPELEAAYKQMQGSYTKRMQELARHKQKVDAYDRFEQNPREVLQEAAARYGLQIVERGQDQAPDQEFKSWDDVKAHFLKEFKKEMAPVYAEVKNLKKQNIETYLNGKYPDWRTYEADMMEKLQAHPSLVNDPDSLYELAVPREVREAKATKAAMQKLKGATEHAQVAGGNQTTKQTTQEPTGPLSFDQAIAVAHSRLQRQGFKGLAG